VGGFVKIYGNKLITSSLWDARPEARLVFLGMLALADADGVVDIPNIRALSRILNLPTSYVEHGLEVLEAPDPGSRTPDDSGRRVVRDGTKWRMVNYEKYREFRTEKQEANRLRIEAWRKRTPVTSNTRNSNVTPVTPEAEAEAEAEKDTDTSVALRAPAVRVSKPTEKTGRNQSAPVGFEAFWASYPRKVGKQAAARNWKRLRPSLDLVLKALAWQVKSEQWTRDGGAFIPHPATWLSQGRWEDEPTERLQVARSKPYHQPPPRIEEPPAWPEKGDA